MDPIVLQIRGGGIWGGRGKQQQSNSAQDNDNEEEYEYEYEYEYYNEDGSVEEGDEISSDDDNEVEYEYYEEEDEKDSLPTPHGEVHGDVQDDIVQDLDSDVDKTDVTQEVEASAEDEQSKVQIGEPKTFLVVDTEPKTILVVDEVDERETIYEEEEEDEGAYEGLFTTPISTANENKNGLQSPRNEFVESEFQNANDEKDYEEYDEEKNNMNNHNENYEDEDDNLFERTPLTKRKNIKSQPRRKASRASRAKQTQSWWQTKQSSKERRQQKRNQQWRPTASSRTSFVPPYSGGIPSFSIRSYGGRPFYTEWVSTISAGLTAVIKPIGNIIQSITYTLISTTSRWISMSWSAVRNTFDYLWYGPIDGVTTTGIATREGGLSALLFSTPVGLVLTSVVVLGLISVMVNRLWQHRVTTIGDGYDSEADDYDDIDPVDPPSVEEELRFLHRDFDAANPSSKDRIAKVITSKQRRLSSILHRRRGNNRRNDSPKSRTGQKKLTIKSIQTWWKERPSQQSIAIIEPQHLRNPQKPLNQEIKKLRKQLTVSEQERAILQLDVQQLQRKLQKARDDARSIVSQNKFLEKQTAQADQIEVQRWEANEDLARAQESMRERMLMRRGRFAENEQRDGTIEGYNDLDLDRGRQATRKLDGVRIVREIDLVNNENKDDNDEKWEAL